MMNSKIISRSKAKRLCRRLKSDGKKIIFTNGTFDILHLGHVVYLEKAKRLGDILVVGVNSNRSVKSYKGPGRPVNSEKDRIRVVAALECVDYAVIFDDPTPLALICEIQPDVLVKGADWKKNKIAGAGEVESWGGCVRRIPLVKGRSTTALLKKMRA